MFNLMTLIYIFEVLLITIPALLSVAFVTIAERKTMASMQRRLGPNIVGYYGLLQAFADALKLLLKEYVSPTQANLILFFLGPIITLIFSLLGYAVIPFGPGLSISDYNLGILYMLAVSSLAEYSSIVLICILTTILFLGGYLYDYLPLVSLFKYIDLDFYLNYFSNKEILVSDPIIEGLIYGLSLGFKSSIMIFVFIWIRASFPRIRFDQLMSFC